MQKSATILALFGLIAVINANAEGDPFTPYIFYDDGEYEAFLKTLKTNKSKSIPIAEYCVAYEKSDRGSAWVNDSANVYLRFEKILQEQPDMSICGANDPKDYKSDFDWTNKFLIHNDLKAERDKGEIYAMGGAFLQYTLIFWTLLLTLSFHITLMNHIGVQALRGISLKKYPFMQKTQIRLPLTSIANSIKKAKLFRLNGNYMQNAIRQILGIHQIPPIQVRILFA
jgi:hypothetical protein